MAVLLALCLCACSGGNTDPSAITQAQETEGEVREMVLKIDGETVPVIWEQNESVSELRSLAENGIEIEMSMYGGFEQVGDIGHRIPRNDSQITTSPGDIVLYSGDQMVIFYGSNSWSYTRLGKINLSDEELENLLGNGDVTITLSTE